MQVCYKEGNRVVRTVHVGSGDSEIAVEKLVKKARGIIERERGTKPMFDLTRFDKK